MTQIEHWTLAIVASFIITLLLLIILIHKRETMLKICKWIFVVSATGGLILYAFAYLPAEAGGYGFLNVALRSIFSTMRMFLMNSDFEAFVEAVGAERLQENAWISFMFLLIHVLAAVVIQAALLSIFGRKLIDYYRLRFLGVIFKRTGIEYKRTEVFIINGCDKNALVLGENIATCDNPGNPENEERIVIFWIGEDDNEKEIQEKVNHFDGIIQKPERKHDRKYFLSKARMGKRNGKRRKYSIIFMPDSISVADDICEISTWAAKEKVPNDNLHIHVFSTSVWSREKLQKLTQEKKINNDNDKDKEERRYPYTIHIVNIEDLLVRQMINKYPPYKCPGLGIKDGEATRGFTVMILGLGFVGESALLHLVMNGQFLGVKMRAIIVDSRKESLSECLKQRYPSLDICCNTEFHGIDVQGEEFYSLLKKEKDIDFIVITLNNDELNKRIALDIRQHFRKRELESEHPIPFPIITAFEKEGTLYEQRDNENIYIFGCRDEILKDSIIIDEHLDKMAMAVNNTYDEDSKWNELDWFSQESSRASADFVPAMLHIADSGNKDGKDKKTYLASKGLHELEDDWILQLKDDFSQALERNKDIREKLAQTEHLRWNAFHAAMGFSKISLEEMQSRFDKGKGAVYARKCTSEQVHACLVPWEDLDAVTEKYNMLVKVANEEIIKKASEAKEEDNDKEKEKSEVKLEKEMDFKDSDRKIVNNIPLFLQKLINKDEKEEEPEKKCSKIILEYPEFLKKWIEATITTHEKWRKARIEKKKNKSLKTKTDIEKEKGTSND